MTQRPEQVFIVNGSENQSLLIPIPRRGTTAGIPETTQVNLENVQDFSHVCRTCATITEFVIPIFSGEGLQNKLAEKIQKHLPIQVCEEDALPHVVCYQCASTLLAVHELAQCALHAHDALQHALHAAKPESTATITNTEEDSQSNDIEPEAPPTDPPEYPKNSLASCYCRYCGTKHFAADFEKHLIVEHCHLIFHCENCDRYEDRKEFMAHMAYHARQYNKAKKRPKKKKSNKEVDCSTEEPQLPFAIVRPQKSAEEINEFSDHSDAEFGFGLSESVLEAIEDSQDNQTIVPTENQNDENSQHRDPVESKDIPLLAIETPIQTSEPLLQNNDPPKPEPEVLLQSINTSVENTTETKHTPDTSQHKIESLPDTLKQTISTMPLKVPKISIAISETANALLRLNQSAENSNTPDIQPKSTKQKKIRTCPKCDKVYTASSSYFYHLKYSHGTKNISCQICNTKFTSKMNLAQHHASIHTKEAKYQCKVCDKRFRSNAGLYIHEQTHSGLKTWACPQCNTSFRWKTEMTRHLKRHAAEKSYVCETCGRGFKLRYDLLRHAKTHSAGSYACDKCGRNFAQQRYLKTHLKRKHSTHVRKRVAKNI